MSDKPGGGSRRIPSERLTRVLGLPGHGGSLSPGAKTTIFFGVLALLTAFVAWLDPRPSLRHVHVGILSGSQTGNYFAIVDKLAEKISRQKGSVANLSSAGSAENVQRLIDGRKRCDVHFALVQDGIAYPDNHSLELVGRLPRPESLIILGRNADRIRTPAELTGLRLGIGPGGSGTEQLMRRVLAPLDDLALVVSSQPIDQQLAMLERGELDLGAMVIDDEAKLVADAVKNRNLQILALPDAASLARRLPFTRIGQIEAGQIDYVRKLPAETKQVLQLDTLIVSNGCASNAATQGLMTAVADVFPTFIRHNKGQPNVTGLPMATVAKTFYDDEGPNLLGKYVPWAEDIMPLPTWIQLGVAFSVLFSAMAFLHRFRLWRVDARRVKIESEISALFGSGVTVGEIGAMPPDPNHGLPETRAQIDGLIERLLELAERCREHSLSVFVPMGQEMAYRYQETLIYDLLHALRLYRERTSK